MSLSLNEHEACLTGLSTVHLHATGEHLIHRHAVASFRAMQLAAARDGVNLQIASAFRDYHRQAAIWQRKVRQFTQPTETDFHSILRWSAMPGASRHHWGTDLDVFDPIALGDQKLQLEPWEYSQDGPQGGLSAWLGKNAAQFGFYRPYQQDLGGVAVEPWHISYAPIATELLDQLTPELLQRVWQNFPPAGAHWLDSHCAALVARYVTNICLA